MKVIEDDTNRWKDILCSWIERINIVKMTTYPGNLQIQCNAYQNTNGIHHRNRTNNSKIFEKHRRPRIAKTLLRKNKNRRYHTFLISNYTTKLQFSKQYGTGTKSDTYINGTK